MVATFRRRVIYCAVIAAVLTALPLAVAYSTGADPGLTAGPISSGAGCNQCHPHATGSGSVELIGAPRRYRAGKAYNLAVRVSDGDKVGAGFEISVEQVGGSIGTLQIIDGVNTQFAQSDPRFITHTSTGVADSLASWAANGSSYDYLIGWDAPAVDVGPLTFFASGNATNHATLFVGENYYWTFATAYYAIPGDGDGDTDLDLTDFAVLQRCFDVGGAVAVGECEFLDMDDDGLIADSDVDLWTLAMEGPTAIYPAGYVLASAVRGGRLYDKWWSEAGVAEPVGDHPLYPPEGDQTGSATHRCQECHGWDYKGVMFGTEPDSAWIPGVFGSIKTAQDMFALLTADPSDVPSGHNMDAFGMSDRDLWDVIRFVKDGVVDTDDFIDPDGTFPGDAELGGIGYGLSCIHCHGVNGDNINFGTTLEPEYVGTIAVNNPWKLLHEMRFGHAGSPMPSTELVGWSIDPLVIAVAAYAATLPVE